jgi:hypothetical protein
MPAGRPLSEFDMALVHDKLNDKVIEWKPVRGRT